MSTLRQLRCGLSAFQCGVSTSLKIMVSVSRLSKILALRMQRSSLTMKGAERRPRLPCILLT